MAHLETFRVNTVDTRAAYVAISRARTSAAIYTNSRASLTDALGLRDGAQVGALDQAGLSFEIALIDTPKSLHEPVRISPSSNGTDLTVPVITTLDLFI